MTPRFSYFVYLEMSGKGKETEAQRDFGNHALESLMSSCMNNSNMLVSGKNIKAIKCITEAQMNIKIKCGHSKFPYL